MWPVIGEDRRFPEERVKSEGDRREPCFTAVHRIAGATRMPPVSGSSIPPSPPTPFRQDTVNSLLPLARGRRWPTGRMRGFFAGCGPGNVVNGVAQGASPFSLFLLQRSKSFVVPPSGGIIAWRNSA